jgi:Ca2+-binding EF-hand superfamily protein
MRTVRAIGFGFAVLAGAAGTVRAQQVGGVNFIELFLQLDANGDQVIDRGEVPESGRPAFDQLLKEADKNHDQKVDREEYRELLQGLRGAGGAGMGNRGERFRALDKNGDGKISKTEFDGPAAMFTRIDANKDGMLARGEVDRFAATGGNGFPAPRFVAMDRDGDGRISRQEFRGGPAVFDRLDTDKDGFLSLPEFRSAAGALPKKAAPRPRPAQQKKDNAGSTSSD